LREPVNARYAAGWLFFGRRDKVAMQRFDPSQLRLEGEARIVIDDAWTFDGRTNFDVSESALAYSRAATIESRLTWFDRSGRPQKSVGPAGPFIHMELSKDERRVALERYDGAKGELWTLDLAREILTRFASGPGWSLHPHWSPDGSAIVYTATDEQSISLFRRDSDGSGREEKLLGLGQNGPKQPTDWSHDYVVYSDLGGSCDLWLLPLSGKRELVRYAAASTRNSQGRVSPDGKWMAYVSQESGDLEVYVAPFPTPSAKWRISTAGGFQPRWRADSQELYYLSPDSTLMAVSIPTPDRAGVPVPLFKTSVVQFFGGFRNDYSPSGNGKRFLINSPTGKAQPQSVSVIVGWSPSS
jgi:dipeptidyl aminopeptidase/acylaminoacyl peptidase